VDENAPTTSGKTIPSAYGDILRWAYVSGLIEIHPEGSWNLTELGKAWMLQPMDDAKSGQPREQWLRELISKL
jgi:hypothetical protein